jgi:hypothetical protein
MVYDIKHNRLLAARMKDGRRWTNRFLLEDDE